MNCRILLLGALALATTACVSLPAGAARDQRDPFESYNRAMYRANRAVDNAVLLPATRAYVKVVPQPLRTGVSHFLGNLSYPRTIVNNLLQGKLKDASSDVARLTVNTVLGLGFFDPASRMGLDAHNEDFGQTLGRWGLPAGPYLMLPVLGPSTVRDAVGRLPDEYTTARHYIKDTTVRWGVTTLDVLDLRAGLLDSERLLRESQDEYSFLRNAWLQRRNYLVHDGNVPVAPDDAEEPNAP
jgi:phospholipid-binding lipoprotein MlaA